MGIQLLCISHKTAPMQVRSLFAFDQRQQALILENLIHFSEIEEAVIVSTCNRMELYCSGERDNHVLKKMQEIVLKEAGADTIEGIHDYLLRFQGERATHHLFLVAAGLDSMVLGEDQILGQVKQAYFYAQERGFCGPVFNNLFRLAITAAKKIKTDTILSKTSVSTASLALKKAEECHGTLEGKKLMVIGASGQIGTIVVKDALDRKGLDVYVTIRQRQPKGFHKETNRYKTIEYKQRYHWMDEMDIIISATTSPHYTITQEHFLKCRITDKKRVFFDLAVPLDIEESIGRLPNTFYFNMENMKEIAQRNQELKQESVVEAEEIIQEYEQRFYKNQIYSQNLDLLNDLKYSIIHEAELEGIEKAWNHFLFHIREEANIGELRDFMALLSRLKM